MFCFNSPQWYSTRDLKNGDCLSMNWNLAEFIFLLELSVITVISRENSINFLIRKSLPFERKRKNKWDDEMNYPLEFNSYDFFRKKVSNTSQKFRKYSQPLVKYFYL